jgi:hypothetical protein
LLKGFRFCGLLLWLGARLWSSSLSIANPSFEAKHPAPGCNGCFGTSAAGWPANGAADRFASIGFFSLPWLTQLTGAPLQLNATSTLAVPIGQRPEPSPPLSSWLVDLEANSVILASDGSLNPLPGSLFPDTISLNSGPAPTQAGEFLRLRMANTSPSGGQVDLDAISPDAVPPDSPEPASVVLLAGGLGTVALMRRRRIIRTVTARQRGASL